MLKLTYCLFCNSSKYVKGNTSFNKNNNNNNSENHHRRNVIIPSSIYFHFIIITCFYSSSSSSSNSDNSSSINSSCRESNSDHHHHPVMQLSLLRRARRRADSSLSHIVSVKNSVIEDGDGAIYMRSLASSRCYIWLTWRKKPISVQCSWTEIYFNYSINLLIKSRC